MAGDALVEVRGLRKQFGGRWSLSRRRPVVHAVDGIDFDIHAGETLALVGESGCGKTTTARMIMRLLDPTAGTIRFDGTPIEALKPARMRRLRSEMQMVFQDPITSLDPRFRVGATIAEPLCVNRRMSASDRRSAVLSLMRRVGLLEEHAERYPHELSGGQRQRVGIARALILSPKFLLVDEPLSALDVSIQAQIVGLLMDLQRERGLTYLFVSHDLSVVRHVANRVAVMYLGKIVEIGPTGSVFGSPRHPYTRALLSAVPNLVSPWRGSRDLPVGEPPDPTDIPSGCRFHTRCPAAFDRCNREAPTLRAVGAGHLAACHLNDAREKGASPA
jgi:oligopeptide/dipeptide ABC transporter ATP-binding protein